jgi:hypothetical protein
MEPTQNQVKFEFKLTAIELLEFSLNFDGKILPDLKLFHYNLNIEHRIVEESKLLIVTTHITVIHEDEVSVLATVKASCVYEIIKIEEIIKKQGNNIAIPEPAALIVNSISISTVRGIMFSLFRGTYLHNAILPVIDPKDMRS